jgi:hypothetical protein
LRHLEETVEQEARKMPILNDILDHKVLGREFKKGLQEGELKGLQEGELKGELKGELRVLRRQMQKRFGALPAWAEERLTSRSTAELEELSECVLDAQSLEDLLK